MNAGHEHDTKQLIDFLPVIYRDENEDTTPGFLALYLRAFERILFGGATLKALDPSGEGDTIGDGLEEKIAAIPSLFDPLHTPPEFVPWLAQWVGLSFHPDLSDERRRKLLASIVPLYRMRGTRRYIEELLNLCLDLFVSVDDTDIPAFQVGEHSTVGDDTCVGGGPPFFFSVRLIAPKLDTAAAATQMSIAHEILALAKPAHTLYKLSLASPRFQIGVHSRVGTDTLVASS